MRSKLFFITISIISVGLAGCGETATNTNTGNTNSSNANLTVAHANNPLATGKKEEAPTTNDAPTIAPVVRTYYESLRKKDEAALRSVLTQEFQKVLEADMKEEGKTTLVEFIAASEMLPDKPIEVRNEKIEGNRAMAEVRGAAYGVWTPFEFAKENGQWKYTGGSPVIESVDPSSKK